MRLRGTLCPAAEPLFSARAAQHLRHQDASEAMAQKVRIALDGMGGDFGPRWSSRGPISRWRAIRTANSSSSATRPRSGPLVEAQPAAQSRLAHRPHRRRGQDGRQAEPGAAPWPLEVARCGLRIDAVKKGEADVAVSAGNTGALMAMAKFNLQHACRASSGPAIAGAVADAAAARASCSTSAPSIGAEAEHLVDLAVMGSAMARVLFDLERPTVGLLNIGVEEVKGLEAVREAGKLLREADLPLPRLSSASSRATTSARARSTWS